jgi:hypothetical protein
MEKFWARVDKGVDPYGTGRVPMEVDKDDEEEAVTERLDDDVEGDLALDGGFEQSLQGAC